MKKLLLAFIVSIFFCLNISAQSLIKVQGYAERGGKSITTSPTTTHKVQESYPNATITVYNAGTLTLASIYSNSTGTVKANPFTADSTGFYYFYVASGSYDIKFSGTGISSPFTLADIKVSTGAINTKDVLTWYDAKQNCGMTGDGVTDDSTELQSCVDIISALGKDATIFFPVGKYKILNLPQDVSLSNAQIVLPKKNDYTQLISIRFLGATPPSTYGSNEESSIIETNLASNANLFGVKNNRASFGNIFDNVSFISVHFENLTFRSPENPSGTLIDASYVPNIFIEHCQFDVANTIDVNPATGLPRFILSQPVNNTSYAIKGPLGNVGNTFYLNDINVIGHYYGIRIAELLTATTVAMGANERPILCIGASNPLHPNNFDRLLVTDSPHVITATGACELNIQNLDLENGAFGGLWTTLVDVFDESTDGLITGNINWHLHDSPFFPPIASGRGSGIIGGLHRNGESYNSVSPYIDIFSGFSAQDNAVDQTYRGKTTSTATSYIAWKTLATKQTGTSGLPVGIVAGVNDAIASPNDKRLGQISFNTAGAINSGNITFATMSGGILGQRWQMYSNGPLLSSGATFATLTSLGATNGAFVWCTDCNIATFPCTGGGAGAWAFGSNGSWKCPF